METRTPYPEVACSSADRRPVDMSSQEAGNSPLCPVCRETGPSLHLEAFRRICGVENSGGHDNAFPCMRQMLLSVDGDSLHAVRSRDRRVAGRVCALISSFLSKTNSVTLWCLVYAGVLLTSWPGWYVTISVRFRTTACSIFLMRFSMADIPVWG